MAIAGSSGSECNGESSIRESIRENIRHKVDWLKIMASGGMMTKGSAAWITQYQFSEVEAAVSEAHAAGKRIASHAHSSEAIENSVNAGVDTIEHCSWITPTGYQFEPRTVEKMVRKNIMICSTTSRAWKCAKSRMEQRYKNTSRMRELGVKFIAGTDAGITHVPFDAYIDGLEVLSELGFSNHQVIEAATHQAAVGCGVAGSNRPALCRDGRGFDCRGRQPGRAIGRAEANRHGHEGRNNLHT